MIDPAKLRKIEEAITFCEYDEVQELILPEPEYTGCHINFKIVSITDKVPSRQDMIPFEIVRHSIMRENKYLMAVPNDEDSQENLIELEKIEKLLRDVTMRYAIQTENTDLLDILDKNGAGLLAPLADGSSPYKLAKDEGKTKIVKWYDDKNAARRERSESLNKGLASKLGMLNNIDANMAQAIIKRNERANEAAAALFSKISGASSK